jgi:hypothetical protein
MGFANGNFEHVIPWLQSNTFPAYPYRAMRLFPGGNDIRLPELGRKYDSA